MLKVVELTGDTVIPKIEENIFDNIEGNNFK